MNLGASVSIDRLGEIEIEATASVLVPPPRGSGQAPSAWRSVKRTKAATLTVVGPESLSIDGVHDAAAREALEPLLRTLRIQRFGSSMHAKLGFPAVKSRDRPNEFQCGGTFTVVANGTAIPIGTYFDSSRGGGGGAGTGQFAPDPGTPLTLRIEPNVDALRKQLSDDARYYDGIIEMDFPGIGQPASAIRWIDPPAK